MKLVEIKGTGFEHDRQVAIAQKLIKSGQLSALWKQMNEGLVDQENKLSEKEEEEILNEFTFIE